MICKRLPKRRESCSSARIQQQDIMQTSTPQDFRGLRRRQPLDDALPVTIRWVARLPAEVRPVTLLRQFPRIANVVARAWNDAAEIQAVLDDLLVDRRGGRQGFPLEVTEELLVLRDYYQGRYPNGVSTGPDDAQDRAPPPG
jgi:hypothetical protein